MRIRLLGTAAGGGFPQWNCNCFNCGGVRAGTVRARPRTQSSVALSPDGRHWFLLNASPDVRGQIESFAPLLPAHAVRGTGVTGILLTNADLDHTLGLLILREGHSLVVHATMAVRRALCEDLRMEAILSRYGGVDWREPPGELTPLPNVAALNESVLAELRASDVLLLDGTFWSEHEMQAAGAGTLSASEMGHVPIGGADGSLAHIAGLPAQLKIYLHINNTNPILREDSAERQAIETAGAVVGVDGQVFTL